MFCNRNKRHSSLSEQVFKIFGPYENHKKLDIDIAISARKIKIWNLFFGKKNHHIVVVYVPSFHFSARSSSFFLAVFLHIYGSIFFVGTLFVRQRHRV